MRWLWSGYLRLHMGVLGIAVLFMLVEGSMVGAISIVAFFQQNLEAGFVLPGGNAGQPKHPHAVDQLDDWIANRQHAAGGSEAQLAAEARHVLEFMPG